MQNAQKAEPTMECKTRTNVYYSFSFSNRQMQTYATILMPIMSESRVAHNESYPQQQCQFW